MEVLQTEAYQKQKNLCDLDLDFGTAFLCLETCNRRNRLVSHFKAIPSSHVAKKGQQHTQIHIYNAGSNHT